jgi:hypothetical protein
MLSASLLIQLADSLRWRTYSGVPPFPSMSSTVSNPKEWLILQCQACGSPMKVRAQAATGARVSCPVCHSPVAVSAAGAGHFPEFRAEVPQGTPELTEAARRRMAEEGSHDTDFMPTLGSRPPAETAPPPSTALPDNEFLQSLKPVVDPDAEEGEPGKRVRKRRKKVSESRSGGLADWNTVHLDQLPEAEILADTWLTPMGLPEEVVREQQHNTVVSETVEDGQTKRRVKRVRRRPIFGFAQLFFRRLSYGVRVTTVIISSIIGIGGMTYAIIAMRQKFKPLDFPDVIEEQRPNKRFLTSQEETAAYNTVIAFLKAQGLEKLPYVRLPNRVRPLMEEWYRRHPDSVCEAGEVIQRGKMQMDEAFFVKLRVNVKEPNPLEPGRTKLVTRDYAVEIVEKENDQREYKIDWEVAVEWTPMSFEEFKRKQPRESIPLRVKMQGSGYYNHGFLDEKRWLACEIYYPRPDDTLEFLFYGYIDRRTKAWEDLAIYTEAGNKGALILALKYPDNAVSYEQVIVEGLVHPSWFYTKDIPPAGVKPEGK